MSPTSVSHPAYYGPAFANAKVHDAMRVGVVTCLPDASPADAARVMAGYGIHCLVVTDPDPAGHGRARGVVDALDVARGEAEGRKRVDEFVTEPVTIDSNASLADAARLMAERVTSHLVAVQPGTDRPVGVVSASGIAAVLAWGRS
ncbi:MAG TPA: CBS domain-containing protein [Thermoleophilaceae bacterium]|nr:CBS domain-containing protein [Thermoleophilaceae bacterium]